MKLFHKPSNSNSTFPLSGSELPIDERAEMLGRVPTREIGGTLVRNEDIPFPRAPSTTLGGCVDKISRCGSFGMVGGVSKPGSDTLTSLEGACPRKDVVVGIGFAWSEGGPEVAVRL